MNVIEQIPGELGVETFNQESRMTEQEPFKIVAEFIAEQHILDALPAESIQLQDDTHSCGLAKKLLKIKQSRSEYAAKRSASSQGDKAHASQKTISKKAAIAAASKKPSNALLTKHKDVPRKIEDRRADEKTAPRATKPAASGHYELSPTMATALNDELNIIMEKIEQVLPKAALNPTQKYVLDKMKQEVCAEFCNVLGLNVAKRTLNIHNGLYVKIRFDREVGPSTLRSLKMRYNIIQMRAVANAPTTYLAVMKDFADFDALCLVKDSKIDNNQFITTPFYKFSQCPGKLKHASFIKEIPTNNTPVKVTINEKHAVVQNTPPKTKSVATCKISPNVASVNELATQKVQSNPVGNKQIGVNTTKANSDVIKLKNNDNSSQVIKESQTAKDVKDISSGLPDITELMAGGIVVDECMGSDDE